MSEMRIVNGRLVSIPPGGATGEQLIRALNPGPGRRPVIGQGINVETIEPRKNYTERALKGKDGKSVMVKHMPDRTKGH